MSMGAQTATGLDSGDASRARAVSVARAALAIAIIACAAAFSFRSTVHGRYLMGDFKAFYCASRVALARENPYALAPMARCERRAVVIPAPLPGYTLAALAPLAALPFAAAAVLWLVILCGATALAIALLVRMNAGDAWTIAVASSIALVAVSFPVGQLLPVAVAGLVLAAFGAARGKTGFVASGVALTMLEPQLGMCVAIACVALSHRTAVTAIAVVAGLGLLSLLFLGVSENVAYVREVLPAHVQAELPAFFQYSLSSALYRLGVGGTAAIDAGKASWICMLAVTAWVARSALARAHPESAILAAGAFSVAGGPYLHADHVVFALPAALWLARNAPRSGAIAAAVALAALNLLTGFLAAGTIVLEPVIAAWVAAAYGKSARAALYGATAALGSIVICLVVVAKTGLSFAPSAVLQPAVGLAQSQWAAFIATDSSSGSPAWWFMKAPVWFGIAATAAMTIAARLRGTYALRCEVPYAPGVARTSTPTSAAASSQLVSRPYQSSH